MGADELTAKAIREHATSVAQLAEQAGVLTELRLGVARFLVAGSIARRDARIVAAATKAPRAWSGAVDAAEKALLAVHDAAGAEPPRTVNRAYRAVVTALGALREEVDVWRVREASVPATGAAHPFLAEDAAAFLDLVRNGLGIDLSQFAALIVCGTKNKPWSRRYPSRSAEQLRSAHRRAHNALRKIAARGGALEDVQHVSLTPEEALARVRAYVRGSPTRARTGV
ncbi:MAG: hypothetical protein HYV09_07830 [Deltaproteobacteria bacterium]|nr:hypothetical protein [Deltaproteobacteria bacterium]